MTMIQINYICNNVTTSIITNQDGYWWYTTIT